MPEPQMTDERWIEIATGNFLNEEVFTVVLECVGEIDRLRARLNHEIAGLEKIMRPRLFKDGNQWCCLAGRNLMQGIAGFGDTPNLAIHDFWMNVEKELLHD